MIGCPTFGSSELLVFPPRNPHNGLVARAPSAVWTAAAQAPATPAPAVKSPEVSADGKITFRLRAPNAKEVFVTGIGQRIALQKNEHGVWTATTDTLKPDIYTYGPRTQSRSSRLSTFSTACHGSRRECVRASQLS